MSSITNTIVLDVCWVCDYDVNLHQHHVIPRNAGGTNGPTVTLCSGCHDGVHDLALLVTPKAPIDAWIPRMPDFNSRWTTRRRCSKALYLAKVIRDSEDRVVTSPNKTFKYSGTLRGSTHRKLQELASALRLSQEATIDHCIQAVHARIIGGSATDHRVT